MRPRLFLMAALLLVCGPAVGGEPDASYRLENRTLHRIDPKLFGHFMERPSWGEVGIEGGLVPGGRELQPGVLERLQKLRIPILRFPGGTDVDYIQLGNETWLFFARMRKRGVASPEEFYVDCLDAGIRAIRRVDATVRIVVDAISPGVAPRIRKRLGRRVDYLVQHHYLPWEIRGARIDGRPVPFRDLEDEQVWYAWVAIPNTVNEWGESILRGVALDAGRKLDYEVAITEWNWNGGYWRTPLEERPLDSSFAKAIGAAGYLHAFLRAGDRVAIACQSMAVGNRWGITGIRADRAGKDEAYFLPTAQVTMLYARHHGERLLALSPRKVPAYVQPLQMGGIRPRHKVAYLDCLATVDDKTIYFHAINRHFSKLLTVRVELSGFSALAGGALHTILEGRLHDKPREGEPREIGRFREATIPVSGRELTAVLPPRSVSCIEIPRGK